MPSCPNCGKYYKSASGVTRHLSQPRTSCLDTIHDLVQITTPSDNDDYLSAHRMGGDDSDPIFRAEVDNNLDMDVDSNSVYEAENVERRGEEAADRFLGAATGYGGGKTFMDLFDSDRFANERKSNLFYPFSGKEDWQIGRYLLASGLSMDSIDRFLSLDWIKTLPLSFRTAKELRGRAELLPPGPQWKCQQIITTHATKTPVWLYWRDPVELLESLFGNPIFRDKIDLVPRKVYQTADRLVRIYTEWMTCDAAWRMQSCVPDGATVLGVVLSSDKTNISALTGDRIAHPLLISLANIHSSVRLKYSSNAFLLAALLPVPKFIHIKRRMRGVLEERLIHQCLDIVLAPLKTAAALGVMMSDPLGIRRYCFTPLASYIVDTPEARMIAIVRDKTSPFTMAKYTQFGDSFRHPPRTAEQTLRQLASIAANPNDIEEYFKQCGEYRLSGVDRPFWRDYPLAQPANFLGPESLHHFHKEFGDHDIKWCTHVVGAEEIDFRFSVLQPITGYRHFREGISRAKQVTGKEHRHMERYVVGIISGAAPHGVVIAIRALMDFRYMALCPVISENGCTRMEDALAEFHAHKDAIVAAGARRGKKKPIDNWFIPKLELMQSVVPSIRANGPIFQWSADLTEHAHITEIKRPSRNTNNNDYNPQICRALDRTEKCRRFQIATTLRISEANKVCDNREDLREDMQGSDDDDDDGDGDKILLTDRPRRSSSNLFLRAEQLSANINPHTPRPLRAFISGSVAFGVGYNPSMTRTLIDDVAEQFRIPDLRPALADYFEHERQGSQAIHLVGGPRRAAADVPLPFKHIQVWFKVRLQRPSFHNSSSLLPPQTVNATPPDKDWAYGRRDAVLVCTDGNHQWPQSGLEGHKVAELQLVLRPLPCGNLGNDRFLAYIQRFDYVPQPNGSCIDRDTQMPVIRRAVRSNGQPLGEIVPLTQIRELVSIIPCFGAKAPPNFTKSNSTHHSPTFFLNKYFTKDQYYAFSHFL